MNENTRIIMAGMFAISNIGLPKPSVDELAIAIKHPPKSLNDAICLLAAQYIESEEMLTMFTEEAEGWMETLKEDGEEYSRLVHSDHWELYDRAVLQSKI